MHMAKLAKWLILTIIIFVIMVNFPTLSPNKPMSTTTKRLTQRGILPGASRRRFQPGSERAISAIVGKGVGEFSNIQEAIKFTNKLGGGRVLIMPGTYHIKNDITLYDDISIDGLSKADVILDFQNSTTCSIVIKDIRNVDIKLLTIKNSNNANGAIYIENNFTVPPEITSNQRINIEGLLFRNNKIDIYSNKGRLINIIANEGIESETFFQSVGASSSIVVIEKNYTNDYSGVAISLATAQNKIIGNQFQNSVGGFYIGAVSPNEFIGNSISTSSGYGVEIVGGDDNHFSANSINSGDTAGVKIKTGSNNNTFTGNRLAGTDYGVDIDATATDNVVVGNFLSGGSGAYRDNGTDSIIEHNGS